MPVPSEHASPDEIPASPPPPPGQRYDGDATARRLGKDNDAPDGYPPPERILSASWPHLGVYRQRILERTKTHLSECYASDLRILERQPQVALRMRPAEKLPARRASKAGASADDMAT